MKISGLYINFETNKMALIIDILEGKEIYEIGNKNYFMIAEYKYFGDNYKIDLTQEKYQSVYSVYIYYIGKDMKYRFFRNGKNIFFQIITRKIMGRIMPIVEKQYKELRNLSLNKPFNYFYYKQDVHKEFTKNDLLKMFIIKEMK